MVKLKSKMIKWWLANIQPKIFQILILVIILLVFCNFFPFFSLVTFKNDLSSRLIFGVITALLTTISINLYKYYSNICFQKEFVGVWQVIEFKTDEYFTKNEYVELEILSEGYFSFKRIFLGEASEIVGNMYFNSSNRYEATLISNYSIKNTIKTIFSTEKMKIYIDKRQKNGTNFPLLKVFNSSGKEEYALFKRADSLNQIIQKSSIAFEETKVDLETFNFDEIFLPYEFKGKRRE